MQRWDRKEASGFLSAALALATVLALGACQPAPQPSTESEPVAEPRPRSGLIPGGMDEVPAPPGRWRPHWLARCDQPDTAGPAVAACLGEVATLLAFREGSDAIAELEICRVEQGASGPVDLQLGLLYLIAGQGEPDLLPREGPAADVGDWPRNQERLLARSELMLRSAGRFRPDDAVVDFLLADVARTRGHDERADSLFWGGLGKCSLRSSFELLRRVKDLGRHAARLEGSVEPEYPESALRREVQGDVVLDLLIDPAGQLVQAVEVASPDPSLTRAAVDGLRKARFEPAKVGKYPLWSWMEVTVAFTLE